MSRRVLRDRNSVQPLPAPCHFLTAQQKVMAIILRLGELPGGGGLEAARQPVHLISPGQIGDPADHAIRNEISLPVVLRERT